MTTKSRFEYWVFEHKGVDFEVLTESIRERNPEREPTWFDTKEAADPICDLVASWFGARDYSVRVRRDGQHGHYVEVVSLGHGICPDNPNPPERGAVRVTR